MYYKKLEDQKKIILRDRKINIFLLCLILPFFFLCLWATFLKAYAFFLLLIPSAVILLDLKFIIENNRLLKQFSSIIKNRTINKFYQVKLCSPKIRFLVYPEIKTRYSWFVRYYGITVSDCNKNKYYYFFDEAMRYDKDSINEICEKFSRELSVQCYENTSIIKTVENDPYFVRIRYGAICG